MSKIMCSVSNCHYWGKGNTCHASSILVTSDDMGQDQPDSFDAPQSSTIQATPVTSCMDTCCKTFVEKDSGDEDLDGVTRNY